MQQLIVEQSVTVKTKKLYFLKYQYCSTLDYTQSYLLPDGEIMYDGFKL
jgi:hypothetical protein